MTRVFLLLTTCFFISVINGNSGNYSNSATDTLTLNMQTADSLLITRNLALLASRYRIDAAKAQVLQAKVFHNPNVNLVGGILNPEKSGVFDIGTTGEKAITISQLFQIAGQRHTGIKIAQESLTLSELEFEELARSLRVKLHEAYFTLWYQEQLLKTVNKQLNILGTTIDAYEGQFAKGNVAMKDLIRLKSQFHQLNDNKTKILSQMDEAGSGMKILLQTNLPVKPSPAPGELRIYDQVSMNVEELINQALERRPDLKMSEARLKQQQLEISLQKKVSIPDLNIQYTWDQNGTYVKNGNLLSVGFSVPVFDRNRGNIRTSQAIANSLEMSLDEQKSEIRQEVETTWRRYRLLDEQYRKVDNDFRSQFDQLNDGLMANYLKKNISLLEFTDLFDAYNQSVSLLYDLRINRINIWEELNYIVGN